MVLARWGVLYLAARCVYVHCRQHRERHRQNLPQQQQQPPHRGHACADIRRPHPPAARTSSSRMMGTTQRGIGRDHLSTDLDGASKRQRRRRRRRRGRQQDPPVESRRARARARARRQLLLFLLPALLTRLLLGAALQVSQLKQQPCGYPPQLNCSSGRRKHASNGGSKQRRGRPRLHRHSSSSSCRSSSLMRRSEAAVIFLCCVTQRRRLLQNVLAAPAEAPALPPPLQLRQGKQSAPPTAMRAPRQQPGHLNRSPSPSRRR